MKTISELIGVGVRRLVLLKFRLRWMFWRGKVCPETGKRCKAMNCNISPDNCYVTYAKWKEENVQSEATPPEPR